MEFIKNKRWQTVFLVGSLAGIVAGMFMDYTRLNFFDREIGEPLFAFSIATFFISLLLFSIAEKVVKSWIHFVAWFLPLASIVIAITPSTSNAWMSILFISKREITEFLVWTYVAITLGLIAYKFIVEKLKQRRVDIS